MASRVAVAIPAYNESAGIGEFLREIDTTLTPVVDELVIVVVDDASTDGTADVVRTLVPELSCELQVVAMEQNSGHGPALLAAYRAALDTRPDYVLAVDGDGQFLGSDLRRVLVLVCDAGYGVCGVRRFRYDPWLRMVLTKALRLYVSTAFAVPARDANCPLRGYPAPLLDDLLQQLPRQALVPNLALTILAARRGMSLVEVDVSHRVRRGGSARGTMFSGRGGSVSATVRLLRFSWRAFGELSRLRRALPREGVTAAPKV